MANNIYRSTDTRQAVTLPLTWGFDHSRPIGTITIIEDGTFEGRLNAGELFDILVKAVHEGESITPLEVSFSYVKGKSKAEGD